MMNKWVVYSCILSMLSLHTIPLLSATSRQAGESYKVLSIKNDVLGKQIRFAKEFELRKLLIDKELSGYQSDQWYFDDFKNFLTNYLEVATNARDAYKTVLSHSSSATNQLRSGRQKGLSKLQDKYDYISDALDTLTSAEKNPVEKIGAIESHRYLYQANLDANIATLKKELADMANLSDDQIGQAYKDKIQSLYKK